jgi:hypothetical protein
MVNLKMPFGVGLFGLIAGILAITTLLSCSNPDDWNPEGTIRPLQLREVEEDGKKYASIDYVIRNSGKSTIATAVASFSLQTDSRRYYFTVTTDCTLPPDRLLYETTQIAYAATTESAVLENLTVDSCHFE